MTTAIETAIETAATDGIKRVVVGGQEVEQLSIQDQIAADKYLASKSAISTTSRGAIFNKISPPGSP